MINLELGTENKIVDAAYDIFLLRGYHGTTLQQIAVKAGVNKSSIHYYFRSKEKLYGIIVKLIVDLVLITDFDISTKSEGLKEPTWFLYTELYNNRRLFENTLRELQPDVWEKKLKYLDDWLGFSITSLSKSYKIITADNNSI